MCHFSFSQQQHSVLLCLCQHCSSEDIERKHGQQSRLSWTSTFRCQSCITSIRFWCCGTSVRTTLRRTAAGSRVSCAARIRGSAVPCSIRRTTASPAATGGCGRTRSTADQCAACPVVRRTHRLCVHCLLVLQLALWPHRFYTGQSVWSPFPSFLTIIFLC